MPTLLRALIWQRVDLPGVEHFRLWEAPDGWRLDGTVVAALDVDDLGLVVRYAGLWESRAALRA